MDEVIRAIVQGACPQPPIDHLAEGGVVRRLVGHLEVDRGEAVFDRTNGNPGPPAKVYEVVNQRQLSPEEEANAAKSAECSSAERGERFTSCGAVAINESEQFIYDAVAELQLIFPDLAEHWLRKCVELRMVGDKWDLARTAWYIFEHENVAPRKKIMLTVSSDENLESQKQKFFNYKHDADFDYRFFAELKLCEMFPKLSTLSMRQIFIDFRWHFMPTAISIAEALENYFEREKKRWSDLRRNEQFYMDVQRDGRLFRYWMRVIGGKRYWNKKKGRMMAMPRMLFAELRMVETWLAKRREQRMASNVKRVAEQEHLRLVSEAKLRGETSECPICGMDYRTKEDAAQCTEAHSYCFRCLRSVCWEIVSGQTSLSLNGRVDCFDPSCEGKFTFGQLNRALEPEHVRRIEEVHLNSVIAAVELKNLVKCDRCLFMAIVETPIEKNHVFTYQNPKCGREVCRLCGEVWKGHEGEKCKPKKTSTEVLQRMKYEEALTNIRMRVCPRCNSPLIKNEGCNYVKCRCNIAICYVCSTSPITYAHFCKHPRTSLRAACTQCNGCGLFEDTMARDQKRVKDLQLARELERISQMEASLNAPSAPTQPTQPGPNPTPKSGGFDPAGAFQRQFG